MVSSQNYRLFFKTHSSAFWRDLEKLVRILRSMVRGVDNQDAGDLCHVLIEDGTHIQKIAEDGSECGEANFDALRMLGHRFKVREV